MLVNNTIETIQNTLNGVKATSFDEYSFWGDDHIYGKEKMDQSYVRLEEDIKNSSLTEEEKNDVIENINQNLVEIVKNNPDINFYYFYTPYSIYYWDNADRDGTLIKQIEAEEIATSLLLEYDNVYLFAFNDDIKMIEDLNNYKDMVHYGKWINSMILNDMKNNKNRLTKDNYKKHYKKVMDIYTNYNYDKLFQ